MTPEDQRFLLIASALSGLLASEGQQIPTPPIAAAERAIALADAVMERLTNNPEPTP